MSKQGRRWFGLTLAGISGAVSGIVLAWVVILLVFFVWLGDGGID